MSNSDKTRSERGIYPERTYSIGELALALDTGRRPLYRAVKKGDLRAAAVNDRGDLRILGSWALAFLDGRAQGPASL